MSEWSLRDSLKFEIKFVDELIQIHYIYKIYIVCSLYGFLFMIILKQLQYACYYDSYN